MTQVYILAFMVVGGKVHCKSLFPGYIVTSQPLGPPISQKQPQWNIHLSRKQYWHNVTSKLWVWIKQFIAVYQNSWIGIWAIFVHHRFMTDPSSTSPTCSLFKAAVRHGLLLWSGVWLFFTSFRSSRGRTKDGRGEKKPLFPDEKGEGSKGEERRV